MTTGFALLVFIGGTFFGMFLFHLSFLYGMKVEYLRKKTFETWHNAYPTDYHSVCDGIYSKGDLGE